MTNLRVFLVDDHAVVREGLKAVVNAQPGIEVVGEAAEGRAALEGARSLKSGSLVVVQFDSGQVW